MSAGAGRRHLRSAPARGVALHRARLGRHALLGVPCRIRLQRDRRGRTVGEVRRAAGRRADPVAGAPTTTSDAATAAIGSQRGRRRARSVVEVGDRRRLGPARLRARAVARATTSSANPARGSTPAAGSAARSRCRSGRARVSSFMSITLRDCGSLTDMCRGPPNLAREGSALERQPLAPRLAEPLAGTRERGIRPRPRDAEHLGELCAVEALPRVQEQDAAVALADARERAAELGVEQGAQLGVVARRGPSPDSGTSSTGRSTCLRRWLASVKPAVR